jgi:hypothetical protein
MAGQELRPSILSSEEFGGKGTFVSELQLANAVSVMNSTDDGMLIVRMAGQEEKPSITLSEEFGRKVIFVSESQQENLVSVISTTEIGIST